eukprot:m.166908 g.166908  ORF g.166908 m.166908 type:complete len:57 (-) comp13456_c0_seq26:952-1122(-)
MWTRKLNTFNTFNTNSVAYAFTTTSSAYIHTHPLCSEILLRARELDPMGLCLVHFQ